MEKIQQLGDVWDNEEISPADLDMLETRAFKAKTGATKVVAVCWIYRGREY